MNEGEDKSASSTNLSAKQKNEGHVKESYKIAVTTSSIARGGVLGLAPCHFRRESISRIDKGNLWGSRLSPSPRVKEDALLNRVTRFSTDWLGLHRPMTWNTMLQCCTTWLQFELRFGRLLPLPEGAGVLLPRFGPDSGGRVFGPLYITMKRFRVKEDAANNFRSGRCLLQRHCSKQPGRTPCLT